MADKWDDEYQAKLNSIIAHKQIVADKLREAATLYPEQPEVQAIFNIAATSIEELCDLLKGASECLDRD